MKIQQKLWAPLVLAGCLTVLVFNACSKKSEEPDASPPDTADITAEKTNIRTFEMVSLESDKPLKSTYDASFGGVGLKLSKSSDSTLTFVVPELKAGEYLLDCELGKLKFQLTPTAVASADQLINSVFQNFDAEVETLEPNTPDAFGDIDSMQLAKGQILQYLDGLTAGEKRQAALFYEANKTFFQPFMNSVNARLYAGTTFRLQQECPRTNYMEFYTCMALNIAYLANELATSLEKASTLFGTESNALVGGMYLLIARVRPTIFRFRVGANDFANAKWVFSDQLFKSATYQFTDKEFKNLNLDARFRTLDEYEDQYLSTQTTSYFEAMRSVSMYWYNFKFLGPFPGGQPGSESASLQAGDITITNITNPRVELRGQSGESVQFNSLNGTDETFQYTLRVEKQGFSHSKVLSAALKAYDSLAFYRDAVVGTWIHTWSSGEKDEYEIKPGGYGYRSYTTNPQGVRTQIEPNDYYNTVSWTVGGTANDFSFGFTYDHRNLGFGGKVSYPSMQITGTYGVTKKQ